jgi:hypothetical protein
MNVILEQFQKEVSALNADIKEHFQKFETAQRELITDGIVNIKEYYDSPIKIMWLLKEPYCDKKNGGGGWSMTAGLNTNRALGKKKDSPGTWHPIIYCSYGILHNYMKFEEIPKIKSNTNVSLILRQIAFVNVQKLPAKTITSDTSLKKSYKEHKEILLKQISTYRPHIIIGGGTLDLLKDDLKIETENELEFGHFFKGKQLFINTLHPTQRKIKRNEYINKVIARAESFKKHTTDKTYAKSKNCK